MAERLAFARARALRQMSDSASVVRHGHTTDADGNDVVTTTTLGPYPCRLEARRNVPFETPQGGALVAVTVWNAYLPAGTDVRPEDTVTVNGANYEVSDQTGARTDAAYTEVLLRRVT